LGFVKKGLFVGSARTASLCQQDVPQHFLEDLNEKIVQVITVNDFNYQVIVIIVISSQ